mgnify:CR=1 FL=1
MNYSNLVELKHKVFAVYGDHETQMKCRIFFAAIDKDGEVKYLDCDKRGKFESADSHRNFLRFEWEGD